MLERGYFRVTIDCDIVMPDVVHVVELLTADLSGPFDRVAGCEGTVKDKRNSVLIKLLPAGRVLKAGCKVSFPFPRRSGTSRTLCPLKNCCRSNSRGCPSYCSAASASQVSR